jgi:hypothetical protein
MEDCKAMIGENQNQQDIVVFDLKRSTVMHKLLHKVDTEMLKALSKRVTQT